MNVRDTSLAACVAVAAFSIASIGAVMAQGPAPAAKAASTPSGPVKSGFDVLKGTWVRPDGGYTIAIRGVGADGQLDAMYFNPKPLPFAKAKATREGATLRADFELRAGGYGGSTYQLSYDPATDRLEGIYNQVVVKQRFGVYFVRK